MSSRTSNRPRAKAMPIEEKRTFKVGLGNTLRLGEKFIAPINEHLGPVISREQFESGKRGVLSREAQLVEAKDRMEKMALPEFSPYRDNPFAEPEDTVAGLHSAIADMLNAIGVGDDHEERLSKMMEALIDILKPWNQPHEQMIDRTRERVFSHNSYAFLIDPKVVSDTGRPLVAGDLLSPSRSTMHEKSRRNMIAVNNQMHLVMLAVAVLRREGYTSHPGLSRADVQDPESGEEFSTKIPILVALNPKIGTLGESGKYIPLEEMAEGEPLALVSAMSRVFPDTEEIELLSDHAIRSVTLAQCALDRVQLELDRVQEELGIIVHDDGQVSLSQEELSTLKGRHTKYRQLVAALKDEKLMSAVEEAGSDLSEAAELWPEEEQQRDFFHVAEILGLIGGTPDGSKGIVRAFNDVVLGMLTGLAASLPEIIMMKPEVARERIRAITQGAKMVDATREQFQKDQDAAKAAKTESGDS